MITSLTAQEIFRRCPQVKRMLWGGEFWSDGYFASTVGKHGDEKMIGNYVKGQGGTDRYPAFAKQKSNLGEIACCGVVYSRVICKSGKQALVNPVKF